MATSTTTGHLISMPASRRIPGQTRAAVSVHHHRKVSQESGRAIEMLGHAIEYLADEFSLECMVRQEPVVAGMHPQVVAIEMLKACNRTVYMSCPEVPTLTERLRAWLHLERV